MAINLRLQIIRKGSEYESFRLTIPRAIIYAHDLRDKDFKLEVKGKKLVLTPIKKTKRK